MTTLENPAQGLLRLDASNQLESYAERLSVHTDYRVLRRFQPKSHYFDNPPAALLRGVILDTETTGKDSKVDKVVELGMIMFEYCPLTGKAYRILKTFNQLEDPGMSIPAEASAVNGITDEMVAGKKIIDEEVQAFIDGTDIIIAHNSPFDRVILERRLPIFANLPWGCSQNQVDWAAQGFGSQKLDYLTYRLGFFFEAHRAEADCRALLEALQRPLPLSDAPALKQIIDTYQRADFRVSALDAKFEKKDELKKRGYRWSDGSDGRDKAWYTDVTEEDYDAEIAWLKSAIYFNKNFRVAVESVNAFNRFSARPGNRTLAFH